MRQGADRRIHQRWEARDTIYGYVDGARFAARSEDLSSGGLFIETRDSVPIGALISLVFRTQVKSEDPPIFLIGRVMRRQKTPTVGIGLRWEKAVFTGSPDILRRFLITHLHLPDPTIVSLTGVKGETKAMHTFSVVPEAPVAPPSEAVPDSTRRGDVPPGAGPVTSRIDKRNALATANVAARLAMDGAEEPVTVHSLGLKGMITSVPPSLDVGPDLEVTVTLTVRTRTGIADILCVCVVTGIDEGGEDDAETLDLEIVDVKEPKGHAELLPRYVRWLHFNALTTA